MELSLKNKSIKETVWSFLTKGATVVLFLLINIILARRLGVENFGLWSVFFSIITIIFAISSGVNGSTKKFVAQYNKTKNLKNVLLSSIKLRFLLSAIFTILVALLHRQIANLLDNSDLAILLLYGSPLVFFSGFVEYFKSVFMGLHRIKYNFLVNILEFGLKLILVLLFFSFSTSVFSVMNSYLIALFITSLMGFYLLYFNFYKNLELGTRDFKKEIAQYSIPLVFIGLGVIVSTEIDTVMIGMFSDTTEVGIYAVAKQIIIKLPHVSLAIAMGTMPVFAKLNKKNKFKLKKKLYNLLKINSILFLIIISGILLLSPIIIPFIFGSEYISSVLPLQILTIYLFCSATSVLLSTFLDYVGKAKKRAINISFTIVLNIILNLILIPNYGAIGAAIATSVSCLPYVLLNWLETRKILYKDSTCK